MRARTNWKRLLALEVSAFGFFGLFWGCFAVLLADLSGVLGLSPGPLGVALFVGRERPLSPWPLSDGPPTAWGGERT